MTASEFMARWRVRLGYVVGALVLYFSRPVWHSILLGAAIGLMGLLLRAYAAGHLCKQAVLTTSGPYAYTRNPLYLGSSIMAVGAAVAMRSWISALLLIIYFSVVYGFVMKREEDELRLQHPDAFDAYSRSVPLFLPRLTPAVQPGGSPASFSWKQFCKNHEQEAALGFVLLLVVLVIVWRMHTA